MFDDGGDAILADDDYASAFDVDNIFVSQFRATFTSVCHIRFKCCVASGFGH